MISLLRQLRDSGAGFKPEMTLSSIEIARRFEIPLGFSHCFLSTGRSAIAHLITQLKLTARDTVIMPAYVAEGVIFPFLAAGINIQFYKLTPALSPDIDDLSKLLTADHSIRLCIVIHPLGFLVSLNVLKKILQKSQVLLLEDCAQALFTAEEQGYRVGEMGDFSLYSLNKFLPVPDGAYLVSHLARISVQVDSQLPANDLAISHYLNHLAVNEALFLEVDNHKVADLLMKVEKTYHGYYEQSGRDLQLRSCSDISMALLSRLDWRELIERRIQNTQYLYQYLNNKAFHFCQKEYRDNVVPMAVPIHVDKSWRTLCVNLLIKKGILLSTLCDKWDFIPEGDSHRFSREGDYLASHLLVPISEFISLEQMAYMVNELNMLVLS